LIKRESHTGAGGTCAQRRAKNGANPHTNGGLVLRDLIMPDFRKYAVKVRRRIGGSLRRAYAGSVFARCGELNKEQRNFRIFGPDETLSNRLNSVFEVTNRQWEARTKDNDEFLATYGG